MFVILDDKTICITRGDIATIMVSANLQDGEPYIFKVGDVVRFQVFKKRDRSDIVIRKEVTVDAETQSVAISLTKDDTKIGELINKHVDYAYEIEVNPDTEPQTIIGYDENGDKTFRLYPEGGQI